MVSCGSTIRENGTYFVNNGYPEPFEGTGSCQATLLKANQDVCQFRLEFAQLNLVGPEEVNHICNTDQFIVSGGNPVPTICGNSMGNHMYIDAGAGIDNPITVSVVTSGSSFQRNWKIRVLQIPCTSLNRAENGCLQYFTGVAGQILSFNYDPTTGAQLSNQDYGICIRAERNFCGIQYTQCPDPTAVNNLTQSFTLSGNSRSRVPAMVGTSGANSCQADYLIIPMASNVGRPITGATTTVDRICGGVLSAEVSTLPSSVKTNVKPFDLWFHTDGVEAPNDSDNKGFCLNYIQLPCSSTLS
ncbi:unnamed protein product [Callosobruchus maculatus]|uniref:CUB domain-containing protein n=1 Tax=Callosobruchus maculatus TaxID=64391 RepID=A0A653C515_CALMS|nr:unnamed protein product [Callosobruchus maculatus]